MEIIGSMELVTFTGEHLIFNVMEDLTFRSESIDISDPIDRIILKPNLEMRYKDNRFIDLDGYGRIKNEARKLIQSVEIDPELLLTLIQARAIKYSTNVAFLYDLDPAYAYDRENNKRAFKHVKDNSKRLVLQKLGQFN